MIKRLLSTTLILVIILISPFAWGNNEKAEFSIHLFQDGLPVADAVLSISSGAFANADAPMVDVEEATFVWRADSESTLTTNANGSAAGKLPAGQYLVEIKTADQTFALDLPLQSAEHVQILVTFYDDGREPLLNIESSASGTFADAASGDEVEQPEEQGNGTIIAQVLSVETKKPIKDVQVFLSGLNPDFPLELSKERKRA